MILEVRARRNPISGHVIYFMLRTWQTGLNNGYPEEGPRSYPLRIEDLAGYHLRPRTVPRQPMFEVVDW